MEYFYKKVGIYADPEDNLIIIPMGLSEKYKVSTDLDLPIVLNSPYTDEALEIAIQDASDKCFSIKPDDDSKETVIEKLLKVKGYAKAVKHRRYINYLWNVDEGYVITPTEKKPKQGYCYMIDNKFKLGHEPKKGEIAKAIREAMKLSTP